MTTPAGAPIPEAVIRAIGLDVQNVRSQKHPGADLAYTVCDLCGCWTFDDAKLVGAGERWSVYIAQTHICGQCLKTRKGNPALFDHFRRMLAYHELRDHVGPPAEAEKPKGPGLYLPGQN